MIHLASSRFHPGILFLQNAFSVLAVLLNNICHSLEEVGKPKRINWTFNSLSDVGNSRPVNRFQTKHKMNKFPPKQYNRPRTPLSALKGSWNGRFHHDHCKGKKQVRTKLTVVSNDFAMIHPNTVHKIGKILYKIKKIQKIDRHAISTIIRTTNGRGGGDLVADLVACRSSVSNVDVDAVEDKGRNLFEAGGLSYVSGVDTNWLGGDIVMLVVDDMS